MAEHYLDWCGFGYVFQPCCSPEFRLVNDKLGGYSLFTWRGRMEWFEAVDILRPHVVRISTPQGHGTGFLVAHASVRDVCAIATAAHVVDHAHYWEQPIRITSVASGRTVLIRPADRAVFLDEGRDTAAVLFETGELGLPNSPIELINEGSVLRIGNTIGWLGFPAVAGTELCFFTGTISALTQEDSAYFVDGVAINGVSGGPAFSIVGGAPFIIGVVSAYIPNRATGETLPGLGIVRDVAQFHDIVARFESVDAAKAEETSPAEPPPPPPGPPGAQPSASRTTS
jgi:hypothetical protein